jgi:protein TonB
MSEVAEQSVAGDPSKRWLQRCLIGLGLALFSGAIVYLVMHLVHTSDGPKHQVAKIMILPDAPPPPPPPPPEDKKPPPPKEEKTMQQQVVPKQEAPPEPAQLKMEGTAGEGPSAFAAGDVKQDYIGGDIGNGSRYSAYGARLAQRFQEELSRHKVHASNVKLLVWLAPDGSIQRYTVEGADPQTERAVRAALAELNHADEAPLADMPMPIGLSVN